MLSLRALKTYNYAYFSLLSLFISFLPVYLSARGVSAAKIGAIIGIGSMIGIVSQPFWGFMSDKYRTVKKMLLLTLAISVLIGTITFSVSNGIVLLLLVALLYFFFLPSDPLTESMNYRLSEQMGVSFGSVRMFGAIGYATTSLIAGAVSTYLGITSFAWLFLGFGLAALLIALRLPDVTAQSKSFALQDLLRFLRNRETVLFFVLMMITALPHRMNDSFLGVYLHSLGASTGLIGLAWFVAAISEITFFALSARLLAKGSERMWIAGAALFYTLRFLLCSLFPTPYAIIMLQLTQGVTFVIFYTASLQYLNRTVPPEWQATGTTLLAILFFGVSGMIGSWLGGWIFGWLGGPALYLVMAGLSLIGFLYAITYRAK
ncbi:MFS transporter [Tumebacillus algifaecis]|uniref:MFS transporter n=1 Tax=Tumebacillus algifaecis TaxID=1214604 RepID=A0A223CXV4_9BACL|nr:MFS transporter [Tumebacillus algifaecis]ASS74055.1 MFS transporter [Tumebacillus algifaecis]